ncbi:MAG: cell division topological specificity factor MinE [Clostridia bacterium]|nr:cell division topological specificity factor MinE [Clostridia bacterium]
MMKLLNKIKGKAEKQSGNSKDAAKERLHLVLMQDRANVSADFLELMKQEIIEVIKKYIEVDENAIDVRLTNKENEDGTNGAPALYANIPIMNIKDEVRQNSKTNSENENKEKTLEETIEQRIEKVMEKVEEEKEREQQQNNYNNVIIDKVEMQDDNKEEKEQISEEDNIPEKIENKETI